jgi:hypothetical protein
MCLWAVSPMLGRCLPSCCPEMALVYPLISQSLHSNGSIRHNMLEEYLYFFKMRIIIRLYSHIDKCLPIQTLVYILFKHILISLTSFMCTPKLYQNIVQYFPPNWITGFPEGYEELIYCLIVLPFFLKYLMNANDLISSWSVMSKPTLMIPNNLIYV